jgi:hypothetical protein
MRYIFAFVLILFPSITLAQTGSLQGLLVGLGGFINTVLIPCVLAIAFLVFVINAVRFFIIGGSSDEGQTNARHLAVYGIGAFVLIISFWGAINLLVDGFGFDLDACADSDYIVRGIAPCRSPFPPPRP